MKLFKLCIGVGLAFHIYVKLSDKHRPLLDFRYIPSNNNDVSASDKIQEADIKIETAKKLYSPMWV